MSSIFADLAVPLNGTLKSPSSAYIKNGKSERAFFRFVWPLNETIKNISNDAILRNLQFTINDIMNSTKRIVFSYDHPSPPT